MANYTTVFFLTWVVLVFGGRAESAINCTVSKTCGQCIQNFGCVWCANPDRDTSERCQDEKKTNCAENFLINPKASSIAYNSVSAPKQEKTSEKQKKDEKNFKSSVSTSSTLKNITSVFPQFINITLRPNNGHPLRIKMRYHQPPDYPLDIYYLMDSSNSLLLEKKTLSLGDLGSALKENVSKITRDLRLGFGSFIEKPVSPFISYDPDRRLCKGCIPTYSFKNHLPLTNDTGSLSRKLRSLQMSTNVDPPESGLDGIMQSVVCAKEIGWREKARRLLVYSTDAPFHIAGDGKLLGILKPNDGCCHLDKNGFYSDSTNQDYPSIQHIHSKVKKNSVNLIFTVTEEMKVLYQKLADVIDGAFVAVKKPDASYNDTIRIISEQYAKITSEIEITDSNLPEQVRIRYYSRCLNSTGPLLERKKCEGLKINNSVEFELQIELMACPTNSSQWNQQFYIGPSTVNEKMTVNLKMLCDCECDDNLKICAKNSSKCSKKGTLKFGICQCDDGFSGDDCSCPSKDAENNSNCREKTGAPICSGQGSCKCNKCHCYSSAAGVHSGKFCQCSNSTCPLNQGKLCSGNGNCECNACKCDEGWLGDDCSCESERKGCQRNSNEEICSHHGNCVCNKCVCNQTEGFSGQFCEKYSASAIAKQCDRFNDCVLRQAHQKDQCTDIFKGKVKIINELEEINQEENTCTVTDNQNCKYRFSFKTIGKEIEIKVLQHPFCDSGPASVLTFVIGIISAIVLLGFLFLMLWKIFIVYQDRKEFAKFEEEQKNAMWENAENPLYRPASRKYQNPLFEEKSEFIYMGKGTKTD